MRASEWLLFAASATLLVLGPAMAYQEFAQLDQAAAEAKEEEARAALTASDPSARDDDYGYREVWRWPLFALVVLVGVTGSALAVRVARRRRWRSVSGRLLGLLLGGMALLDVAYLVDIQWAFGLPFLARGWTVVWLYSLSAILVAGALYRLNELEPIFGHDRAPAPPLSPGMLASAGEAPRDEWR